MVKRILNLFLCVVFISAQVLPQISWPESRSCGIGLGAVVGLLIGCGVSKNAITDWIKTERSSSASGDEKKRARKEIFSKIPEVLLMAAAGGLAGGWRSDLKRAAQKPVRSVSDAQTMTNEPVCSVVIMPHEGVQKPVRSVSDAQTMTNESVRSVMTMLHEGAEVTMPTVECLRMLMAKHEKNGKSIDEVLTRLAHDVRGKWGTLGENFSADKLKNGNVDKLVTLLESIEIPPAFPSGAEDIATLYGDRLYGKISGQPNLSAGSYQHVKLQTLKDIDKLTFLAHFSTSSEKDYASVPSERQYEFLEKLNVIALPANPPWSFYNCEQHKLRSWLNAQKNGAYWFEPNVRLNCPVVG